jgi:15-cis-phytoene desaturase
VGADSIHIQPFVYQPIKEWVESKGGRVVCSSPVLKIELNEGDSTVKSLKLANGTTVTADYYLLAIPVDVLKRANTNPVVDKSLLQTT